jgi:NADH dehydrogenase FAD-containing subunit
MELNQNKPRKLFVDPFLRVIGARDVISLGDCSSIIDNPLPPTAQVAGQQGAYVAHLINRKYNIGTGGIDMLPPWKPSENLSLADKIFSSVTDSIADSTDEDSVPIVVLKKPFEFLSLGIMASLSSSEAVAQVEAFDGKLNVWGQPAFLLWKSVYITKQVSVRNRILILFDWIKTQVFGRDLSQF